jgi:hypothetical protein
MESIGRALMYKGPLGHRFESRNEYVDTEFAPRQGRPAAMQVTDRLEKLFLLGTALIMWLAQQLGFGVVIPALIYIFWQFALHRSGPVRAEEARL